jgi:hypothetical protein
VARTFAGVYTELFKNVPLLAIIFITYFGLASIGVRFNAFEAGTLSLILFYGAYLSEIFRAALPAVLPVRKAGDGLGALQIRCTPFHSESGCPRSLCSVEIHALGPVGIVGPASQLAPKPRALLAILVAARGRTVSVDTLVEELWPTRRPGNPANLVQQYVGRVRSALDDIVDRGGERPAGGQHRIKQVTLTAGEIVR